MYTLPFSVLDHQTRIANERHELEAEQAVILSFFDQLGMIPYQPSGHLAKARNGNDEALSLADSLRVILKGKYKCLKDRSVNVGTSYSFSHCTLFMDYVVEKQLNGKNNCLITLQRMGSGQSGTNIGCYYEADTANDVVGQVVDFMVNDYRFEPFQIALRKYKIDMILKDLEENFHV